MEQIHFTPNQILNKEFRQKMRGYDPNDVDSFLDDVIKDYDTFDKETQQLQDENNRLRSQVDELNRQLAMSQETTSSNGPVSPDNSFQGTPQPSPAPSMNNATTIDILKRLSNLERRVFGTQMGNGSSDSHRF
ncbi:cell division regulator GpsB [Lactobacillus sp. Sy-1]|uniref:cell division regulator GpsB n=1 Tax=Lactobacillus sp. Sy-1 TaxID=2109645 RepID=UPI001C5740D4|nr:cell division regulator GpsB [Lactobacillus sp. Sy-1]MBW1605591.1 cell division regulator GpsB [Lactobacillus sp. Sy-1]